MRETTGKWGKIEEMFLSCPPESERLATALQYSHLKNECYHMNEWLTYFVLGGGYTQEDTLTYHLCYHTHRKLTLTDS